MYVISYIYLIKLNITIYGFKQNLHKKVPVTNNAFVFNILLLGTYIKKSKVNGFFFILFFCNI